MWAALEAHSCGALDFAEADRYDKRWLLKEHLVLENIIRKMALDYTKYSVDSLGSMLSIDRLSQESLDELLDALKQQAKSIYALAVPWGKKGGSGKKIKGAELKSVFDKMCEDYYKAFGHPDSKEGRENIKKTLDWVAKNRKRNNAGRKS